MEASQFNVSRTRDGSALVGPVAALPCRSPRPPAAAPCSCLRCWCLVDDGRRRRARQCSEYVHPYVGPETSTTHMRINRRPDTRTLDRFRSIHSTRLHSHASISTRTQPCVG